MKYLFSIVLILSFLPTNVFAESERPQAIVIPISSMGAVTKSQKQILQNTLEDNLKSYFTLISQELFEQAQEKAFEELDYEECTEDQCIMLIQEMLQVENVFHFQVIREGQDTQLSLSWRTLDEKKKETDVCRNCDTFEINDRIERLIDVIVGITKEIKPTKESSSILYKIRFDGLLSLFSDSKSNSKQIPANNIKNSNTITFYFSKYFGVGYGRSSIILDRQRTVQTSYGDYIYDDFKSLENEFIDLNAEYPSKNFNLGLGYSYPYSSVAVKHYSEKNYILESYNISFGYFILNNRV